MTNVLMIAAALLVLVITLNPKTLRAPVWRATVTPLASIIGSGFLIAGPVLAHTSGRGAVLGMMLLCGFAYVFGICIRFNIRHLEPLLNTAETPRFVRWSERVSDLALLLAYFVSVAYYVSLFASFGLKGLAIVDPNLTRIAATTVIALLGAIGGLQGLRWLEHIEIVTVGIKLSLIAGVVAALAFAATTLFGSGLVPGPVDHLGGEQEIRTLLGLIVLVQGFETSRYLGDSYDADVRIRTMRYSQWLASLIYVVFILLVTPHFSGGLPESGGETAIVDMLRPTAFLVAPFLIITALASQLSAAVADMNGAGGIVESTAGQKLGLKAGYVVTAAAAIGITWGANIFEIITYASKAFVLYYLIQAVTAALLSWRKGHWTILGAAGLSILVGIAVLLFGMPAEGG